ncbi:Abi family protein [Staphylococcus aureus]|uniref:Abi family protein n=2 Tax=Staphylococcus aureus TaxID=1280 RepID=UPI0018EE202B|nr:Abi family protein [Staphylococcus aureus]MBJ6273832.1 Abi family protein [Staphylococcus aureus]MBJ6280662.1 Abi family protein [Staphylococcus aureus]MBJ6281636.1 Abi family protein [Staphylococcus aureus]MBJ6286054.1 Abi family protein [Staphylococcus aureus]MBJ6287965.1 Abi family protein [Staphylococcus aureus]
MEPKALSFQEQADLLQDRGMIIKNSDNAIKKLENIGYYKLKEFAHPLSKVTKDEFGNNIRIYNEVNFDDVITRYYQDKNLRMGLLHAIEKIEVSLKTRISYVLGETYGAFGYLNFSKWCNKNEYCKHYLNYQENRFKKELYKKIKLSRSYELQDKKNLNERKLPSIWLMTDVLMFGDIVNLLTLMSKKNLQKISNYYKCSNRELISWLKCLNFIRNICAHNSNVIDIKLTTAPIVYEKWKGDIFQFKDGNYSNRLAIVIFIIHHFIEQINDRYKIQKITKAIHNIVGNDILRINQLGFVNKDSITKLQRLSY